MDVKTILIVEDDPDILELVQFNVERRGYKSVLASDGEAGLRLAEELRPDLIILDLMMPGIGGLAVCQQIKENEDIKHVPIIMLTAKSEEADIVTGLELGADDYITKPFSPKELMARVKAALRSRAPAAVAGASVMVTKKVGPIAVDSDRHEIKLHDKLLALTLAEYKLVEALAERPGRVFTREQLLQKIAGEETYLIDRNVDVHVRSIRKKFGEDSEWIQTIRGVGYKCAEV